MSWYSFKENVKGVVLIIGIVLVVIVVLGLIFLFFTPPGWVVLGLIVAKLLGAF